LTQGWVVVVIIVLLSRLIYLQAGRSTSKERDGTYVFPLALSFRILTAAGLLLSAWFLLAGLNQRALSLISGGALLTVLFLKVASGPIVVSAAGLHQQQWLGLKKLWIPWTEVESAVHDPARETTTVVSASGKEITHTKLFADAVEFRRLVAQHTTIRNPAKSLFTTE
jgi:hypothetical protein